MDLSLADRREPTNYSRAISADTGRGSRRLLPNWEHGRIVRVISLEELEAYQRQYADARGSLRAWYRETRRAEWRMPTDVTNSLSNARTLPDGYVVFNIKGNQYRPIVRINYGLGLVDVRQFGTHAMYNGCM
jgi:mRNA interferase HigB